MQVKMKLVLLLKDGLCFREMSMKLKSLAQYWSKSDQAAPPSPSLLEQFSSSQVAITSPCYASGKRMRSNCGVTLILLNLKKNFHERYSVQYIFCEIIVCLGDTEMWLFSSPLVEEAQKSIFRNSLCSFLNNIRRFLRLICSGKTE